MTSQTLDTRATRVTGPASFMGSCRPCELIFAGIRGSKAQHDHMKAAHPFYRVKPYATPRWANGKATPWKAPKRTRTLEATLALWSDFDIEVHSL